MLRKQETRPTLTGRRGPESGMTLVETMVAVALLGIVTLAFYQTYNASQRHLVKGQAVMDMQQNARIALETITAELRSARAIQVMADDQVSFVSDLYTGGQSRTLRMDAEDADLDGKVQELILRRTPADDGTPTIQTDEIATSIGDVSFRYLNSLDGLSEAQSPDQIRRIEVTVTGRLPGAYADSTEITFRTVVRPRNLRLPQPPNPDGEAPGAPANVLLTPTCGVIDISWDANTEEDLAGYRVFYKTGSSGEPYNGAGAAQGSSPIYVGNRTAFRLTGLDAAETYYIVLTAVDASGNQSTPSIERLAMPNDGDAPSAPTGLGVEVGGEDALVMAWTASPEKDVAFYRVYYDSDASGTPYALDDSTTGTKLRVDGLTTGETYYLAVTANDACGNESGLSQEVTGVPTPCSEDPTPPAAPQGLEGLAGDGRATLEWLANSEPDLSLYRLLYSWGSGADSIDVGLGTGYELTGLTNEVDYTFRVVALDGCGNRSPASAAVVVRPMSCAGDDRPPVAPSYVAVEDAKSVDGDELLVSWAPNSEGDLAGYRIYVGGAPRSYGDPIDAGNDIFFTLTGLVPEQRYYVSVVAYDRCGNVSGFSYEEDGVPSCGCACNPGVTLLYPTEGAVLEDVVPLEVGVSACSSQTVSKVELLVGTFPERTWLAPPYTHNWDTDRWPDGTYGLVVRATDSENCVGRDTVTVVVDNTGTGPGCVRVDASVAPEVSGAFDEEVNYSVRNTSSVQTVELRSLTTDWTSANPEKAVACLHRVEVPAGTSVWDSGPDVADAARSGDTVALESYPSITGGNGATVRLLFWHEDGEWHTGGATNMPMGDVLFRTQAGVWPERTCHADSFYTQCTVGVSNLTVTTGRHYRVDMLDVGDFYYIDRTYVLEGIPTDFEGLVWILTANDDKTQGNTYRLEFDVDRDVTLYVAYDPRGLPPNWIRTYFTSVGQSIDVSDTGVNVLGLWSRNYSAGHIVLYGNKATGAGAAVGTNYVVLLRCR